ncbi:hypothetical protein [Rothia uropygialis]|uniref:hypothetical protein n=1 Tax=Kocuria sp. 36 TaxID=1415402 RepID=UPI00101BABE7|nr:hypothetical protein [Kocuria sp. 36]
MASTATLKTILRYSPVGIALHVLTHGLRSRATKTFLIVFFAIMLGGTGIANAADNSDPGTGITTIVPMPDYAHGGGKTLVEDVSADQYKIDDGIDDNPVNAGPKMANGLVNTVFMTTVELSWVLVVITSWLLGSSDAGDDAFDLADLIGKTASETMGWLFPTALAVAAVMAWANRKKNGGGLQDFAVIGIIGVIATSFVLYPATYVKGMETVRNGGQQFVSSLMPESEGQYAHPFEWGNPDYSQNTPTQGFARKSADTVWRASVATQWCMVEFGSTAPCEKYGPKMLKETDDKKRQDIIKKEIYKDPDLGGKDGKVGKWIHGEDWGQRLGMALVSLAIVALLLFLVATLVFSAVIAMFQAILLLVMGTLFLSMAMIPGAPRRWGANWALALAGALLGSIGSLMLLTVSLGAIISLFGNTALQWYQQYALAVLILFAAVGLRKLIHSLVSNAADTSGGAGTLTRVVQAMTFRRMVRSFTSMGGRGGPRAKDGAPGQSGRNGRSGRDAAGNTRNRPANNDVVAQRMNSRPNRAAAPSPTASKNPATQAHAAPSASMRSAARAESSGQQPVSKANATPSRAGSSAASTRPATAAAPVSAAHSSVTPAHTPAHAAAPRTAKRAEASRPVSSVAKARPAKVNPSTPATVQPAEKRQSQQSPVMRSNDGMSRPKPPATRPQPQQTTTAARTAGQQRRAQVIQAKEKAQSQKVDQRTGLRGGPPARNQSTVAAKRRDRQGSENR